MRIAANADQVRRATTKKATTTKTTTTEYRQKKREKRTEEVVPSDWARNACGRFLVRSFPIGPISTSSSSSSAVSLWFPLLLGLPLPPFRFSGGLLSRPITGAAFLRVPTGNTSEIFFQKKKNSRERHGERERELITSDKQISVEKMLKIAEKIRSSLNRSGETTSCPNTVAVFRCVETSASFLLRNNK